MKFAWDPKKNRTNKRAHGISFEEAQELFESGADYLSRFDCGHSDDEDRYVAIGPIARGVISVVYTERDMDVTRIISARAASEDEIEEYRSYVEGEWK